MGNGGDLHRRAGKFRPNGGSQTLPFSLDTLCGGKCGVRAGRLQSSLSGRPRLLGEGGRGLPRVVALGGTGASGPYRSHARGGCHDSAVAPFYYLPWGPSGAPWPQHSAASVLGIRGAVAAAGRALKLIFRMHLPNINLQLIVDCLLLVSVFGKQGGERVLGPPTLNIPSYSLCTSLSSPPLFT